MLHASFNVSVVINSNLERVFAHVSDLSRHAEWSSDSLQILPLSTGPIEVGSRYKSTAHSRAGTFAAELVVTDYDPPSRFGFSGEDATGKFRHNFKFVSDRNTTLVTREVQLDLSFLQWLVFFILFYPVRISAAKRALKSLKRLLESG